MGERGGSAPQEPVVPDAHRRRLVDQQGVGRHEEDVLAVILAPIAEEGQAQQGRRALGEAIPGPTVVDIDQKIVGPGEGGHCGRKAVWGLHRRLALRGQGRGDWNANP
ncbi:hypothetical protein GCM10017620_06460 [Brevundimonas intermedia]|uniref:Uncharacterized protein n=1 Tax=Brevundimonas intermedia TaxID=74315 RepID=A0ABQ5T5J3_9CAUL|nr:hypothetical protein GCM10017620_06460 [Brevundimonas intermedia]